MKINTKIHLYQHDYILWKSFSFKNDTDVFKLSFELTVTLGSDCTDVASLINLG